MGSSNWSDDLYKDRVTTRSLRSTPTFANNTYSKMGVTAGTAAFAADVSSGKIVDDPTLRSSITRGGLHPKLDPNGVVFRECRDSEAHPNAVPVSVLLDVTGSMAEVPVIVQGKLPALMGLLIRKGYLDHPAIQIVALGDATCDRIPLQVGQFESGIEIEDDLTNLYLEGGGGGQVTESYELALHFMDKHTVSDNWEKRGSKGYLFIIGDENPYPNLKISEVQHVIGTNISESQTVEQVIENLREKWEVFFILPKMTSHWNNSNVRNRWEKLLPQRCIYLEDPNLICETIAAQIGLFEDSTDKTLFTDLADAGLSSSGVASVTKALVPIGSDRPAKGTVQSVASSGAPSGLTTF